MTRMLTSLLLLAVAGVVGAQDFTRLYPDTQAMEEARRYANGGDYDQAHKYYLEAAEFGNKEAQKLIGLQYLEGQGVEEDKARALAWLKLASSFGDPRIQASYRELEMTLDEDVKKRSEKVYKDIADDYGDKDALKKRKRWGRKEIRDMGSGAGRPSPMDQAQIQIDGRYYRVRMGELMDAMDEYVDEFEEKMKG